MKHVEDFLNCTDAMVICITANVSMNTKLIGTLERDINARETLFNQRKNVGEVAIMPRVTAVSSQYMFFPVLKVSERAHATTQDMTRCHMKLREEAERLGVTVLAVPCNDDVREDVPWSHVYYDLDLVLRGIDLLVHVYDHYYLSCPRYN